MVPEPLRHATRLPTIGESGDERKHAAQHRAAANSPKVPGSGTTATAAPGEAANAWPAAGAPTTEGS